MSGTLPIVRRELVRQTRRRGFHIARYLLALAAGAIVLIAYTTAMQATNSAIGLAVFIPLITVLIIAGCFLGAWNASPLIAQEKEEQKLELLFLTDIRARHVVLAKLLSALFSTTVYVLIGLPLIVLCSSLGGLSAAQALMWVALALASIYLGVTTGLLASSLAYTVSRALFFSILLSLLFFLALPYVFGIWSGGYDTVETTAYSPVFTVLAFLDGEQAPPVIRSTLIAMLTGTLLYAAAAGFLCLLGSGAGWLSRTLPRAVRQLKAVRGNPVAWRCRTNGFGRWTPIIWFCLLLFAGWCAQKKFYWVAEDSLIGFVELCAVGCALIFGLGTLMTAGRSFAGEKRKGTLDLLLLSDLSEEDVVLGKLWGSVRAWQGWLIGMCGAFLLFGYLQPDFFPLPISGIFFLTLMILAFASLGVYLSLVFKGVLALILLSLLCFLWCSLIKWGILTGWWTLVIHALLINTCLAKTTQRLKSIRGKVAA